jgi:ABC-type glutathione transport system ATPase component
MVVAGSASAAAFCSSAIFLIKPVASIAQGFVTPAELHRRLQIPFQHPLRSLDPRRPCGGEPTYVLISDDPSVVETIARRIAVTDAGGIFEWAPAERIFADPRNPYTRQIRPPW